ncbi:MAG: RhuM family protein, partial [bacterium]
MTDATGKGSIIIYQPENNIPALEVRLEEETVWLSQKQISQLFETERSVITKHINNVFNTGELRKNSVCAKFAHTATDGKTYQTQYYNLDMIISVGYRVNSKMGTQFRIWATNILKQHIIQGYTINEKRLQEARDNFRKLKESVEVFQRVVENRTLTDAEAKGIVQVIRDYAHALDTLDGYDRQSLTIENVNRDEHFTLDYDNARSALQELIKAESQKPGRGDL